MYDLQQQPERVKHVDAYVDTLELFFFRYKDASGRYRCLPKGLRGVIEATQGRPPIIRRRKNANGWVPGYRVIVHQPTPATLQLFDALQLKHGAVICRFDIAYDFSTVTRQWLERHAVLKWRRPGVMLEEPGGIYFIQQVDRSKRSDRDIYLYDDRPSKVTGELDVPHLDLRFQNAEAVRAQGIDQATDLIRLDPMWLFKKHLKLVDVDIEAIEQRIIRKSLEAERQGHQRRHNRKHHPFVEQYRTTLAYRLGCQLNRLIRGRGQLITDLLPDMVRKAPRLSIEVLKLPNQLVFPPGHHDNNTCCPRFTKYSSDFNERGVPNAG